VYQNKDEMTGETFLVMPAARAHMERFLKPVLLVLCTNSRNTPFVWPIPVTDQANGSRARGNAWNATALLALESSKTHWTQMVTNLQKGRYELEKRNRFDLIPVWPELAPAEVLSLTFADHCLRSPDDPIVKEANLVA
jgi:hypothetical protein